MKRLCLGVALALSLALLSSSSAFALGCEECVPSGYACGIFGCNYVYTCVATSSFCSECWEICNETLDGYCDIRWGCQWAAEPSTGDRIALTPTTAVLPLAP